MSVLGQLGLDRRRRRPSRAGRQPVKTSGSQVRVDHQQAVQLGAQRPLGVEQRLHSLVGLGSRHLPGRRHPPRQQVRPGSDHPPRAQVVTGQPEEQRRRVVLKGTGGQKLIKLFEFRLAHVAPTQELRHLHQVVGAGLLQAPRGTKRLRRDTQVPGHPLHRLGWSRGHIVGHEAQPRKCAQLNSHSQAIHRTPVRADEGLIRRRQREVSDQLLAADPREPSQPVQLHVGEDLRRHGILLRPTEHRSMEPPAGARSQGRLRTSSAVSVGYCAKTTGPPRGVNYVPRWSGRACACPRVSPTAFWRCDEG